MIRRPPRSTLSSSSAASDVYKRQVSTQSTGTVGRMECTHPEARSIRLSSQAPTQLTFEYSPTKQPLGLPELQQLTKPQIRAILVDLLRREDELRLAPAVQQVYRAIGDDETELSNFTAKIQHAVCDEFCIEPSVGSELIRSAMSLFPGDDELRNIPHYVRHNRCFEGTLTEGDTPPDCKVVGLDGKQQQLRSLLRPTGPVVLLAASHT
eukprot:TRINITY_DN29617_c0_g1_i1.p2 TRINITY_DN29617_c0_g1~~TRINITY_DN29617_c0_g1_i1.p2  ORF type:complete len:209 (-),score=67.01 TRINITY_DN29617_c0_g1_i1:784-1410(-)